MPPASSSGLRAGDYRGTTACRVGSRVRKFARFEGSVRGFGGSVRRFGGSVRRFDVRGFATYGCGSGLRHAVAAGRILEPPNPRTEPVEPIEPPEPRILVLPGQS